MRACAWCKKPLHLKRADAVTCSQPCRQARQRRLKRPARSLPVAPPATPTVELDGLSPAGIQAALSPAITATVDDFLAVWNAHHELTGYTPARRGSYCVCGWSKPKLPHEDFDHAAHKRHRAAEVLEALNKLTLENT